MYEATWLARAKVNLSLRVGSLDPSGYHRLRSLATTIDWTDELSISETDEDTLDIVGSDLDAGPENLVWKALDVLAGGSRPRFRMSLRKRLPVAAGLGGGSADAAAALSAGAEAMGLSGRDVLAVAPAVGSDVPFAIAGGTAWMEGRGEVIVPEATTLHFVVAVVVPPFLLSTPDVFHRWDQMGEPLGPEIPSNRLPPSLRGIGPIVNDLHPAAVDLRPDLGDWIADLEKQWGRPVQLSGSGPAVYGMFADMDEGSAAVVEATVEDRGRRACEIGVAGPERIDR